MVGGNGDTFSYITGGQKAPQAFRPHDHYILRSFPECPLKLYQNPFTPKERSLHKALAGGGSAVVKGPCILKYRRQGEDSHDSPEGDEVPTNAGIGTRED